MEDPFVDEWDEPDPELNRITNAIIGAAIEVHRELGPGYPEAMYQKALEIELTDRKVAFLSQHPIKVLYKAQLIGEGRIDLLVMDKVVVELKAVDKLMPVHTGQMISYLKATGCRLGLIMNFNVRTLREGIKRIAR